MTAAYISVWSSQVDDLGVCTLRDDDLLTMEAGPSDLSPAFIWQNACKSYTYFIEDKACLFLENETEVQTGEEVISCDSLVITLLKKKVWLNPISLTLLEW